MLKLSSKRSQLKKRWEDSLAVYDKIEIVEETEVKEEFITVVMFMDALRTLLIIVFSGIIGAVIGIPFLKSLTLIDILEYLVVIIYVGIFVMSILLSIKNFIH